VIIVEKYIKISIVVPIYNVENYLRKCIESIINQTYKNIEIILVDDGSTDASPYICDYYSSLDERIKVIHKENGGLVSARKAGTDIAIGDYILNVDGDDWIEKDRVEVLVIEGIGLFEADMVYLSGYRRDFDKHSVLMESKNPIGVYYGNEIKEQLFPLLYNVSKVFQIGLRSTIWMWAIKRELIKEKQRLVDDRIIIGEDAICVWFCLLSANSVSLIKHSGYHYIQRRSSLCYMAIDTQEKYHIGLNILYHQLRMYIKEYGAYCGEIKQIFICLILQLIIVSNYELVLKKHKDYLFPYPLVKRGDKVIVYGAGRMGYSLMNYLIKSQEYQVVLWVDQNIERPTIPGYKISPIRDIIQADYDYIVIAVVLSDMAEEIRESLLLMGISGKKVVTMNPNVITEEAIPDEILRDL